ncbi:MAG TPA: LPS-assembly protein LptD, partial [Leptospiraceae bacterium]|nr:LPS-assembly protein LptD [Leptospiraceae bacterium]
PQSDQTDLVRQILPGQENNSAKDEPKKPGVTETQKKLLRKILNQLSDREVDEYLFQLGLSTSGSVYAKRLRLRDGIGADKDEPVKEDLNPSLQDKNKQAPFIIENASEGEYLSMDKTKSGVLVLRGNVKIKLAEGSLSAETISVDSKKNEIYAEGGIVYKNGPMEVKGDKFIYDIKLDRGIIYETKAALHPTYFVGKKIKKVDENKYLLDMGYFTTCNAEVPHYSFRAKKIFVYEDKSIVATNLSLKVGAAPIFWTPLFFGSNLGSGWMVQFGQNRTQGKFLQTSYQWSDPTAIPSLLMPVGRKIKFDAYQITGYHAGFEFWKVSPHLNYNLDLGVADYHHYQFATRYAGYVPGKFGELDRFLVPGQNEIVTTNQVDRGDSCTRVGAVCVRNQDIFASQGITTSRLPSIGPQNETWWKGNLIANIKSNNVANDGTRNLQIRYENYTNPRFDYEYGFRYDPGNTLQALYTNRTSRNPLFRSNLTWNADYTETRGDLSINVSARRMQTYYFLNNASNGVDRSGFFPVRDELPRTQIRNSSNIANLPYFNSPVYWDMNLTNLVVRSYGGPVRTPLAGSTSALVIDDPYGKYKTNLLRTEYTTNMETGFRTNMNFGSYVTLTPGIYGGMQKKSMERADSTATASTGELSLERFYKRESYKFLRQNHRLSFGVPALLFSTTYRRILASGRELAEPVLKDGKDAQHEVEFALESNAFEDFEMSVRTIRDLRQFSDQYRPAPTSQERWYFTVFRLGTFYDFYDGFSKKRSTLLERQRSFFSGIFLNNDHVYHTAQKRPLYNNASLGYQMGGFSFWFIRNIKSLELGGSFYHVYNHTAMRNLGAYDLNTANPADPQTYGSYVDYAKGHLSTFGSGSLDNYRIYFQTDIQITRYFGIEFESDSRLTQPWRYTDQVGYQGFYRNGQDPYVIADFMKTNTYQPVSPAQDVVNSTGLNGSYGKNNSAFNTYRNMIVAKWNLHDFEFRLGYVSDLRALPGGPTFDSQITFYDQSVFFGLNLTNILGSEDPTLNQARARLYRFRKRPLDAGFRSSVTAQ